MMPPRAWATLVAHLEKVRALLVARLERSTGYACSPLESEESRKKEKCTGDEKLLVIPETKKPAVASATTGYISARRRLP